MRHLALTIALAALSGCSADEPPGLSAAGEGGGGGVPTSIDPHAEAGVTSGAPAEACAPCHPTHVREWGMSSHAYAMQDPVFHAMVRVGQAETEGELGDFCVKCHSPVGVATGQLEVTFDESLGVYTQRTEGLRADAMAGVSCESCHSIVSVESTANAGFTLSLDGVRRATISSPIESSAHASEYSGLHKRSELCGTCHQVVNDRGFPVERTHQEWVQSRFNNAQSCQNCHMKAYEGPAVKNGPTREVHRHTFEGVDVSLLPEEAFPGYAEMRELTAELLRESATIAVVADPATRSLEVTIENLAGHALPSGATSDREMWLELLVTSEAGETVMQSGTLDERGDLRTDDATHTTAPGTDIQLVLFTQRLLDDPTKDDPTAMGPARPVAFLWEPNADESHVVPAGGRVRPTYDLSGLPAGAYTASVRLLFRSFPNHLLRMLEEIADLDPAVRQRVPVVEMEQTSLSFRLD